MDNPPAIPQDDDAVTSADTEDSPELRRSVSASLFSGPIPPPALMREYAEFDPEFPRRFIEIFERQQAHDHEVEKAVLSNNKEIILGNQDLLRRGQLFGFVLALVGLIGGLIASFLGSPIAGSIIVREASPSWPEFLYTARKTLPLHNSCLLYLSHFSLPKAIQANQ